MKPGKDCIGIGVGAVIYDPTPGVTRVLLAKRGLACPYDVGLWEFPGGKVDFGETLSETVIREVQEEVGLLVRPISMLPVSELVRPDNGMHWLGFSFICVPAPESGPAVILEPTKCTELRWCEPHEVDELPLSIWARMDWEKLSGRSVGGFDSWLRR